MIRIEGRLVILNINRVSLSSINILLLHKKLEIDVRFIVIFIVAEQFGNLLTHLCWTLTSVKLIIA